MPGSGSLSELSQASDNQQGVTVSLKDLIALRYPARALNLTGYKNVSTTGSGQYLSNFRGRGIDFSEVRLYQPGDDVRSIDWRVTARTGKPYTKLYREERERPVYIILDYSDSLFFGTKVAFKSVIATQAAALLAWAALNNGDKIGGVIVSGQQQFVIKPKGGARAVLGLLKQLEQTSKPHPVVNDEHALQTALISLRRIIRPGSLVFIISDFMSFDEQVLSHFVQLVKHNDVVAIWPFDHLEVEPPPPDRYIISDGKHLATLDTAIPEVVKKYKNYFSSRRSIVQTEFDHYRVPLLFVETSDSVTTVLQNAFRE